ncbi:hypothetical protein LJY25_16360 [Hymenobacter sp. BT175]|uniref:hypothetical protein n=1 Tax=Hymenobacter translucens TaxID=2886507 RepID=UPI001D0DE8F3|nr:hypothetical protein [Hymenobacter translucens]MCC2548023.1 hypothetical protein [Hymenobacter translucens]
MSYDLMVFDPVAASKTRTDFTGWYEAQTQFTEDHSYDNSSVTTPELRAWLMEMMLTFPDLNGDDATQDTKSDYETDYSVGRAVIYACFSWSLAKEANEMAYQLAQKHQVGFFNPNVQTPALFPINGRLKPMEEAYPQDQVIKKPWWKVW